MAEVPQESTLSTPRQAIARLMRMLSYVAASVVIVLALLVGVARLLLPIVPEYRAEIRRWAEEATGFSVEFERISASWPINGPELSLYNVTVADPDDEQTLIRAESFRVGVGVLSLFGGGPPTPSRIVIEGTRLELERDPDGTVLVQGRPLAELIQLDPDREQELPELRLDLADIDVVYRDTGRTGQEFGFRIDQLDVELTPRLVRAEGDLELDERYGERLSLALDVPVAVLAASDAERGAAGEAPAWQVYMTGDNLQLANLTRLGAGQDLALRQGRGDLTVSANLVSRRMMDVTVDGVFEELLVVDADDNEYQFSAVSGRGEWQRRAAGWLLSGSDLSIARDQREYRAMDFTLEHQRADTSEAGTIVAKANRVPLDDVLPMARAFLSDELRDKYLPADLRGDVLDLDLVFTPREEADPDYSVKMRVEEFGVADGRSGQSVYGISGELDADQAGGRLQIASGVSQATLPEIFPEPLDMETVDGFLVWRVTDDQVRILSDNVDVRTPYAEASARFELDFPRDGGSPQLDLTGVARADDASQTVRYLPLRKFPPDTAQWLQRAIGGGRVLNADIEVRGPLAEFPFRGPDEGLFRIAVDVDDAILDFADKWPRVEDLAGRVVFEGVSIFSQKSTGTIAGLPFTGNVQIKDLATSILEVTSKGNVVFEDALRFLRQTPIADELGPVLDDITGSGNLKTDFSLTLPVARANDFELAIDVDALGNAIGLEGLNFGFTGLKGPLQIRNFDVSAEDLSASLLGEPVRVDIRPASPEERSYSHVATIAGMTPAQKWIETLSLPFGEYIDGSLPWRAIALIPARKKAPESKLHILVDSSLDGMEITLPRPLTKAAAQRRPVTLDIRFTDENQLDLTGEMLDELAWALRLKRVDELWQVERMAAHSGVDRVEMPANPGVELSGRFSYLNVDRWLDVTEGDPNPAWRELYKEATIDVDQLSVFGMVFRELAVELATGELDWRIKVDGPTASGSLTIPLDRGTNRAVDLEMQRLHLVETDEAAESTADPRNFSRARVDVEDFVIGDMQFGGLQTSVSRVPDGVLVNPIQTTAPSFSMQGEGAWLVQRADETRQRSRLRLAMSSTDIKSTLVSLGYDPVIEGEQANAALDLNWAGGPRRDFVDRSEGTFELKMERGMLLELDPGGGRLLGVLSVAALPRRLSLDFSDVLDEGLGFDVLQGKFSLENGNAYTCNLSLEGSVTDMGVVGRTGLSAEDYQQLAVIRPHMSNVLPLGGVVVGGPGVGAAMWIFSQVFRKPLSTLGESYYRVSGNWNDPVIDRLPGNELDSAAFSNCEQYLAALQANLNQS